MPFLWGTGSAGRASGERREREGEELNKCSSCVNAVIAGIDIETRDYRNNVARAVALHCLYEPWVLTHGCYAMRIESNCEFNICTLSNMGF